MKIAGTFAATCSSLPTAVCWRLLERWVYRLLMLMSRCPSNAFTGGKSTPTVTKRLANVWQRS
jgi:hypothetical protein